MTFKLFDCGAQVAVKHRGKVYRFKLPIAMYWKTVTWPIRMRLRNGVWPRGA